MAVTIKGSGQLIVQIAQVVKSDTFSTSSQPFVDITGLSVSITPTSASNRILVVYTSNVNADVQGTGYAVRLMRDSTPIFVGDAASNRPRATTGGSSINVYAPTPISGMFLDAPATTSAVTYKLQVSCTNGSPTLYVNRSIADRDTTYYDARLASDIVVMEVSYA